MGFPCAAAGAEPANPATAARGSDKAAPPPTPPAAKSDSPRDREAGYVARLDKIIAPLRDYDLSADDIAKVAAAFKAIASNGAAKAADLKAGISDPLAQRLIDWERLRRGQGEAAEYLAFLTQNPDWPNRELLERRMEETLFQEGGDADVIATYFKSGTPHGAAGMAVLASVYLAHGEKDKAQALAAKVWREHDLPADLERGFLSRFGSLLSSRTSMAARPAARRRRALQDRP
jgi:soluble lytic murein transglycosylase